MTQEQKRHIRQLRAAGEGYKRISTLLDIPVGTIKSFCRRDEADEPAVTDYRAPQKLEITIENENPICPQCGDAGHPYTWQEKARVLLGSLSRRPTGARRRMPTENLLCAPGAGSRCMGMTGAGSFAATPVTSTAALESSEEADMHGTEQRDGARPC